MENTGYGQTEGWLRRTRAPEQEQREQRGQSKLAQRGFTVVDIGNNVPSLNVVRNLNGLEPISEYSAFYGGEINVLWPVK